MVSTVFSLVMVLPLVVGAFESSLDAQGALSEERSTADPVEDYLYLGCFKDQDVPNRAGVSGPWGPKTLYAGTEHETKIGSDSNYCADLCVEEAFGLQWSGQCFCGSVSDFMQHGQADGPIDDNSLPDNGFCRNCLQDYPSDSVEENFYGRWANCVFVKASVGIGRWAQSIFGNLTEASSTITNLELELTAEQEAHNLTKGNLTEASSTITNLELELTAEQEAHNLTKGLLATANENITAATQNIAALRAANETAVSKSETLEEQIKELQANVTSAQWTKQEALGHVIEAKADLEALIVSEDQ